MLKTFYGIQCSHKGATFWIEDTVTNEANYSSTPCFPYTSKDYAEKAIARGVLDGFKHDSIRIISTEVYVSE